MSQTKAQLIDNLVQPITGALGSASAPTFSFTADPNTGVYSPGADQLAVATNGTGRLFVNSLGLVGIGTSSPIGLLQLKYATNVNTSFRNSSAAGLTAGTLVEAVNDGFSAFTPYYIRASEYGFGTDSGGTYVPRFTIDSSGRVGIGTTSPSKAFVVSNGGANGIELAASPFSEIISYNRSTAAYTSLSYGATAHIFNGTSSEFARVDSSGRLLVGTSTALNAGMIDVATSVSSDASRVQVASASWNEPCFASYSYQTAGIVFSQLIFNRSTSGTVGTIGPAIASNVPLGGITFSASDGTKFVPAALIRADCDGTSGTNDMPGRLVFSTTADGASSPTERGRIISNGHTKFSNTGSYLSSAAAYHEIRSDQDYGLLLTNTNASLAANVLELGASRSANSAYRLAVFYSGYASSNDLEFNLRGDGNAYADGTWNGGGADYAELFEWNDSNPDAEDRRGISVVLDGDKIREAVAGEDPIGVISGNPSVVGDAAWNKWSGKYLRDEFNSYLLDENGDRQLNPAFDPDVEYISREQRPEWDCVGLMGKLRIRKGQVTGSRWIKMRNINDSVEEWLVR